MIERLKDDVFAEPRGGKLPWVQLTFGLIVVLVALGIRFDLVAADRWLRFVTLGVSLLCLGGAEIIPRNRNRTAGVLRISSVLGFILFGLLVYTGIG